MAACCGVVCVVGRWQVTKHIHNLEVVHHLGNPTFRRHLEKLPIERFHSVLILADERHEEDSMHSDSSSLATLLLMAVVAGGIGGLRLIAFARTPEAAQPAGADA